jgi:hypothetical protein
LRMCWQSSPVPLLSSSPCLYWEVYTNQRHGLFSNKVTSSLTSLTDHCFLSIILIYLSQHVTLTFQTLPDSQK